MSSHLGVGVGNVICLMGEIIIIPDLRKHHKGETTGSEMGWKHWKFNIGLSDIYMYIPVVLNTFLYGHVQSWYLLSCIHVEMAFI